MCGRYIFYDGLDPYIRSLMEAAEGIYDDSVFTQISFYDVMPSQLALAAVMTKSGSPAVRTMRWGFPGFDGKLIINARSETFSEKKMFRDTHPCILPASAYYEWGPDRQRYAFTCSQKPVFMAGLCRKEEDGLHFMILTEEAPAPQSQVHDRQPVIFTKADSVLWMRTKKQTLITDKGLHSRILFQKSA
ncbi:MAG: SOS response-associated peptidase [Solobacterium sp.]|nr:SOS response-associated peptidase [Solobacterium sp.]